jgi:lipid biosynthesis B12-binding/radical SAM protein
LAESARGTRPGDSIPMKVLLVSANIASAPYAVYPLGMSMVAGALRDAGHEVRQFDFLHAGMSLDALADAVNESAPEIIGISIRNIDNVNLVNEKRYIDVVGDIVRRIRQETDVPVVLGGSAFSIMPEAILREVGGDYGIVGEGESSMVEFVTNAAHGVYPDKRCIRASSLLDGGAVPSPDFDSRLMAFYLERGNIASVQSKRGCTHQCVYCSYPLLEGSAVRCREPAAVVDEIQILVERHDAGHLFFTDSVFNDEQGRYLELVREMKERGVTIPWTAFFKPEGLDDEGVELMKETGLTSAEIGADAATDTTLRRLGKPFRFNDIVECNDLFGRHGIGTAHFYMFGGPGETRETVLEGIENIRKMERTVSFIYMGLRILPGTPLARIAQREGLLSSDQELLESVYYIAPGIDKEWLEATLTAGFSGLRHCVFPPDILDSSLQFLYKLGHAGFLWDMLIPGDRRARRRSRRNGRR